ncbi:hypothetical protein [Pseudomonas jinjuensis]|uniref:hypothetical protein n=1 Tax=Pseudomonas jinjuensis TaxID=198616 RepID=UPI001113638E|nr:hypothetical protein [Pseudomonas jinjuensis]
MIIMATKFPASSYFAFTRDGSLDNVMGIAARQAVVSQGWPSSGVSPRYEMPTPAPFSLPRSAIDGHRFILSSKTCDPLPLRHEMADEEI